MINKMTEEQYVHNTSNIVDLIYGLARFRLTLSPGRAENQNVSVLRGKGGKWFSKIAYCITFSV